MAQVGLREVNSGSLPMAYVYPTTETVKPLTRGPYQLMVALGAKPSPARHLVVISHGSGGDWYSNMTQAVVLAQAGFVVAMPLHAGDNYKDHGQMGPQAWQTRPQEISASIDAVAADAVWSKQLDLQHVGVHGMSAGGLTALVMAGGQWKGLAMAQHCAQHGDEDAGFCFYGTRGRWWANATRRLLNGFVLVVPERFLPKIMTATQGGPRSLSQTVDPRPDPRVAAASAVVPVGALFLPESLQRITIPVGLTTAGQDQLLNPQFHSQMVLHHCPRCTVISANPSAGHMDWLSPWPADLAAQVADILTIGGTVHPEFNDSMRMQAFLQVSEFFKANLKP
jgi:predicted dienelactone hydrolase